MQDDPGAPTPAKRTRRTTKASISAANDLGPNSAQGSGAADLLPDTPTPAPTKRKKSSRASSKKGSGAGATSGSLDDPAPSPAEDSTQGFGAEDLFHNAPPAGPWDHVKRWVVFSDLHVSTKSLRVCIQVLQRVRQEALERGAGVLFLGTCQLRLMCVLFLVRAACD